MKKRSLPLSKVFGHLEPGPLVMITTSEYGKPNVMTLAWTIVMDWKPLIGIVMGQEDYSFHILKKTKQCVINIPTVDIAKKVIGCGSTTGKRTDKFAKFGIATSPAKKVDAPLIDECYVNIECKVIDTTLVNRYNFFVLEGVKAWIDPSVKDPKTMHHRGFGNFAISGKIVKLPFRVPKH